MSRLTAELIEEVTSPVKQTDFEAALSPILDELDCPDAELEILITDDARMQALNKQHRGVDATTDVLSLPTAIDSEQGSVVPLGNHAVHLGAIAISLPQAARQVGRFGDDLRSEVLGLARHGLRHVLGYDHDDDGNWLPR